MPIAIDPDQKTEYILEDERTDHRPAVFLLPTLNGRQMGRLQSLLGAIEAETVTVPDPDSPDPDSQPKGPESIGRQMAIYADIVDLFLAGWRDFSMRGGLAAPFAPGSDTPPTTYLNSDAIMELALAIVQHQTAKADASKD